MKRSALVLAALLGVTAANAQIYQWKDEKGRTTISDKPPAGDVMVPRRIETNPSTAPSGNTPTAKSTADRELEFRQRLKESDEKAEAAKKAEAETAAKKENCDRARRQLQALESGERIGLRDEKGERYFMDDAQRAQETAKTRQVIEASCSK